MAGKTEDQISPPNLKSENSDSDNTSLGFEDPEPMDYYDFFKLCKIDVSEDDVSSLENDGFDMETIFS